MRLPRSPFTSWSVLLLNLSALVLHLLLYNNGRESGLPQAQKAEGAPECPPAQQRQQQFHERSNIWVDDWDGMHEAVMGVPGVHWTNRRIFLVRHGQYRSEGPEQGHLSSLGIKQAHLVGRRLRDLNLTFSSFLTSSSIRAEETAKIVHEYFPKLKLETSALLKEGKPLFPQPPIETWDPADKDFQSDGPRIEEAFRTFIHRPPSTQPHTTNEIIIAHGNVISYFTLRALQLSPVRWVQLSIMQGSITMMELSTNGHVTVRMVGDVGHIPANQWTG